MVGNNGCKNPDSGAFSTILALLSGQKIPTTFSLKFPTAVKVITIIEYSGIDMEIFQFRP